MKYHKVRGKSVAECMMKLRSNHGPEAIILEHREINEDGFLGSGLFSRKSYEIDYMLPEKRSSASASLISPAFSHTPPSVSQTLAHKTSLSKSSRRKKVDHSYLASNQANEAKSISTTSKVEAEPLLNPRALYASSPPPLPPLIKTEPHHNMHGNEALIDPNSAQEVNKHLLRLQNQLSKSQMRPAFIDNFLHLIEDNLSPIEKQEYHAIEKKAWQILSQMIRTVPSRPPVRGECRAFMLMGPTGSGKTTSLAKLAARFHLIDKRGVSIYSLDQYRLAATEQLKTYANVMDIDFHAPLSNQDFAEALKRDGAEIILIDTSGISHTDQKRMDELKSYVNTCEQEISLESSLVLAANLNPGLLENILVAYEPIGFDKIILTKVDESNFIGAFVEIADKFKRPFSFVMDGQEVPANIRDADTKEIASIILGLANNE